MRGDDIRSIALLEESRAAAETVSDRRLAGILVGWVFVNLAVIARSSGDRTLAAEHLEAALRFEREADYREAIIMVLGDLGDLARDRGNHTRALELYREALRLVRGDPGRRVITEVIEAVGVAAALVGASGARCQAIERGRDAARAPPPALSGPGQRAAWRRPSLPPRRRSASQRSRPPGPPVGPWGRSRRSPRRWNRFRLFPTTPLTRREMEILQLLAADQTDPAIAEALFISVRTVENHVAHILAKLGVHTRTEAAAVAIASGLTHRTSPFKLKKSGPTRPPPPARA